MHQRLHPDHLGALPADVARPTLARGALQAGIVHLGIGAFMRAHLAPITEAALAAGDTRFGIVGVSLRRSDTRDALAPQDGLYTLAVRDVDAHGQPRTRLQVIGAVLSVLVAPDDPQAVLDQIADPATRIVSLTVTEKGYCLDPATGRLRLDHPDIAHDLAQGEGAVTPVSAIGFLVHGLALRRARGRGPVTLLSLDNLPANGHTLRGAVLALAEAVDPGLAQWIAADCTFPCSMVDRIVPRTTEADRAMVRARLGLDDAWPVLCEPFLDWAVEDRFVAGRPDWTLGGARFVEQAEPWEHLKLRMVNGTHSCIAYLSVMAGWTTVDAAIAQPDLHAFIAALMREEIEPTLPALPGLDLAVYRQRLLQRYANPALAHRTQQIAMDGSQKLPQRLLGTVRDRLKDGQSVARLGLAVAAWLHGLRGVDERGQPCPVDDPQAEALTARYRATIGRQLDGDTVRAMLGHGPVFGDLAGCAPLVDAVLAALQSLTSRGVAGTLRQWAVSGFDVLCLGETMAMLVADEPGPLAQVQHFSKRLAGADTNVAIGLSRLGLRVAWISRLGADSFGDYVRAAVEAEGIDTSRVQTDPGRSTGFMLKARSVDGRDPAIEYYRRGSAASQLGPAHFDADWALQARHLHATGITPALSPAACDLVALAMRTFRASGRSVSFDPNLRPSLWPDTATMQGTLNALAAHADWVLPGIEEGRLLTGRDTPEAIADFYLARGARAVVVKLGADGAHVCTAGGESLHVPGEVVSLIVDTVGAGDAFAVGIISARLEGRSWPEALRRANWIAARALQVVGDMEGLPMRHELPVPLSTGHAPSAVSPTVCR